MHLKCLHCISIFRWASIFLILTSLVAVPIYSKAESAGQSIPGWQAGFHLDGVDGSVVAMTYMDGNLYVGGTFTAAGDQVVNNVARWTGSQWEPVGNGLSGSVSSLATDGQKYLYATGLFDPYAHDTKWGIARWDGIRWEPITGELKGEFNRLAVDSQGNLYVAGKIYVTDFYSVFGVARWDGLTWQLIGDPLWKRLESQSTMGYAASIAIRSDGLMCIGGYFEYSSWATLNGVACLDGEHWKPLGDGVTTNSSRGVPAVITALAFTDQGDLVVGGHFIQAGSISANNVAIWTGGSWLPMGEGVTALQQFPVPVSDLVVNDGTIYITGGFTLQDGGPVTSIARWTGTQWEPTINDQGITGSTETGWLLRLIFTPDQKLYAAGGFASIGGVLANRIAVLLPDAADWSPLGNSTAPNGILRALAIDSADRVAVGGRFSGVAGQPAHSVARWDGQVWNSLGGGPYLNGYTTEIFCLAYDHKDILFAGGQFRVVPNIPEKIYDAISFISFWNGYSWQFLSLTVDGLGISSIAFDSENQVYSTMTVLDSEGSRTEEISRWNGQKRIWEPVGEGMTGRIDRLIVDHSDHLYAIGRFDGQTPSTTELMDWDGLTWKDLGNHLAQSAEVDNQNRLYLGYKGVERWDGISFENVGGPFSMGAPVWEPSINALAIDRYLRTYAGGLYNQAGDIEIMNLARWNGLAWKPVDGGVDNTVFALAVDSVGRLYVAGDFSTVGKDRLVSTHFAIWTPLEMQQTYLPLINQ